MRVNTLSKNEVTICDFFASERDNRTMPLRSFAKELGVTYTAIYRWEHRQDVPSTDTLIEMWQSAKVEWVRALALKCLTVRYPKVFSQLAS